jgi:hypothetical protein
MKHIFKKNKLIALLFISVSGFKLHSQQLADKSSYLTFGANVGTFGWAANSQQKIDGYQTFRRTLNSGPVLLTSADGNTKTSLSANTSIGVNLGYTWKRTKHFYSLGAEWQRNKMCYSFTVPLAFPYKERTFSKMVESDIYDYTAAFAQYSWLKSNTWLNGSMYNYIRVSVGLTNNQTNFGKTITTNNREDWTENGLGFKTKTISVNNSSWMISPEIGKRFFYANINSTLDVGIVYHYALQNTYINEYEYFSQNKSIGKTQLTFRGSAFHLNLRYNFNVQLKQKRRDTAQISATKEFDFRQLVKINNRKPKFQNTVIVNQDSISILVWDKNKVDGDIISLYLNGELVLSNFTISKHKKEISLKLNTGSNYLTLYAVDLGRTPPNTAAFKLITNKKETNITLISDENENGTLEIIYKP